MSGRISRQPDVLVVGGGLGGVAAALAAVRRGASVVLTEETRWLGGALTTQAAPPDEHRWIERMGGPASYRALRTTIRDIYRRWYPLESAARRRRHLNPGGGWVSPLCAEPRVASLAIDCILAPHVASGSLTIRLGHRPVAADVHADRIRAVMLEGPDGGRSEVAATVAPAIDSPRSNDSTP
jgi:2-polyprenyl-6-methoxyphenol hydroxylase-like FAD-dependent oxidoreductase